MNNKKNTHIKPLLNQSSIVITPCDQTPSNPCGEEFKCKYILQKIDEIALDTICKISDSIAIVKTHDQLVQELCTLSTLFGILYDITIESFIETSMLIELGGANQTDTSCCCCETIVNSIISINKASRKAKTDLLNLLATKSTDHADTDPFVSCDPSCFPLVNYETYCEMASSINDFIYTLASIIEEIMLMHHSNIIQLLCNNCNSTNQSILQNYLSSLEEFSNEVFGDNLPFRDISKNFKPMKTLILERKEKINEKIKISILKINENKKQSLNTK